MIEERHLAALKEVHESIEEALKDVRGLLPRQRRLTAMLSLGTAHIIEIYLHKLKAIKPGAQIKHDWFKAENKRIKLRLMGSLTKSIENLPQIEKIIEIGREIEQKRNELVYGADLRNDGLLKEKLNLFFELKKVIEETIEEEVKW